MIGNYGELLNDVAERLRSASTTGELQQLLIDFSTGLGFSYIWCGVHQPSGRRRDHGDPICTFPQSSVVCGPDDMSLTPMQRYAELGPDGFYWDDPGFLRWLTARQKTFLNALRKQGLANGFTFPIRRDLGAGVSCSLAALDDSIGERSLDLAQLLIPSIYTRVLLLRQDMGLDRTQAVLSPRQRDCLFLKASGNTDREIADGLGISIGTVARHIDLARHVLSARSREHAIAKALKSGQIT